MIWGISFDTVEENRAFAEKFKFPFDLLSDPDRMVGLAYGACDAAGDTHARRISFLIDADGRVHRAYDEVQPAKHAAEVLADVTKLNAGG